MMERFPRCGLCGRLVAALMGEHCSDRCREVAEGGYTSPHVSAAALRPPTTTFDVRVIVTAVLPERLPDGCEHVHTIGGRGGGRELLRFGADDWDEIDAVLNDLRESVGADRVQLYTQQRFTPGGLARPSHHTHGGPR